MSITKQEILDIIQNNNNQRESGVLYILMKLKVNIGDVLPEDVQKLRKTVSALLSKRNEKFVAARRIRERFNLLNKEWLNSEFKIPDLNTINVEKLSAEIRPGRPSIEFEDKSKRSQRRESAKISAQCNHDPLRIVMACRHAARQSGHKDLNAILKEISKSPQRPAKVRKLLDTSTITITKKTPEEGLAFILDNHLSKSTYLNMRLESKSCGADIWPNYSDVRAVKEKCRPPKETISIYENVAEVALQPLLNHTAKRIIDMQAAVILQTLRRTDCMEVDSVLTCTWGFDGSTGHSAYQQRWQNKENMSDESLFATTVIPLRLATSTGLILWNNRASQSSRFCRPIKLEFVKESIDVILRQKQLIEDQIKELNIFEVVVEDCIIRVHFSMLLILIDGKVLNAITNTKSSQSCPICHATPKQFNDLSNKDKGTFLADHQSLQHGISPLHAWIRFFECCLHISYRITINKWQVRSAEDKKEFAVRKKVIQNVIWEKLGLRVDKPKSGGSGTSNDGNTARRAFENPDLFADCLNLDRQLIHKFKTILIALSCQLPLDPNRFEELCHATAELYVTCYPWYPMPSTVHKILMHGAEIISTSLLPVGMLGEEASEARNKDYKRYRRDHSRKHNRETNLEDIFYRVMDTSDPVVSSISLEKRIKNQKRLPLPPDVVELFAIPNTDATSSIASEDELQEDLSGFSEFISNLDEIQLSGEE